MIIRRDGLYRAGIAVAYTVCAALFLGSAYEFGKGEVASAATLAGLGLVPLLLSFVVEPAGPNRVRSNRLW